MKASRIAVLFAAAGLSVTGLGAQGQAPMLLMLNLAKLEVVARISAGSGPDGLAWSARR